MIKFYEDLRIKGYVIIAFALLKKLKGKADIGPCLSKCCKSRYFIVYLHVVNHAISTEIFHEKSRCNEEKIKSHLDPGPPNGKLQYENIAISVHSIKLKPD